MKNTFLLFFLFPVILFAQAHQDCITAIPLCNKDLVHISNTGGIGNITDEMEPTSCLSQEFSSTWFQWSIATAGILTFTIVPDSADDDLDFAVFKVNTWGDCDNKSLLRCVAAGENVGQPFPNWEACVGPTGLAFGETDLEEAPGCNNGNNNFVAPLDCLPGEVYVMIVNNFSSSGGGFFIDFCNDSNPTCASINCDSTAASVSAILPANGISFSANPVSNSSLEVRFSGFTESGAKVWFADIKGSVFTLNRTSYPNTAYRTFDVSNLPNGMYAIIVQTSTGIHSSRFVVKR